VRGGEAINIPRAQARILEPNTHDVNRLVGQAGIMPIIELEKCVGVDQLLAGHPAEDDVEACLGGGADDVEERLEELELARVGVSTLRAALAEDGLGRLRVAHDLHESSPQPTPVPLMTRTALA